MAEFVIEAGSGMLDLTATPLAGLPDINELELDATVDRLIQPCGDISDTVTVIGGHVRIWQNYKTER